MPAPVTCSPATFELGKSVVAWLLVILGWMVVSDQQAAREFAKNCYARLQALRDELREIEAAAVQHHTTSYDPSTVRTILRKVSEIGIEIGHLRRVDCLPVDAPMAVMKFRQAISGKNFDASSYQQQTIPSPIIDGIEVTKNLLDRLLLDATHEVTVKQPSLLSSLWSAFKRIF